MSTSSGTGAADPRGIVKALGKWRSALAIFPDELAHALAPIVARLDAVIGPAMREERAGRAEPAGYDGIARRGTYARLLMSEWLLASEAPEEFLRRVVNAEHAFLRVARDEDVKPRATIVVFDVGPETWGGPRIVQLALLLLFAERARDARAHLEWRPLTRDAAAENFIVSGGAALPESHVRALLQSGDDFPSLQDEVDDLAAALASNAPGGDPERWFIGGSLAATLAARTRGRLIELEDIYEIGARRVRVRAITRGLPREAVLELPEDRVASRILRDPFANDAPRRTTRKRRDIERAVPLFSVCGTRIFFRLKDGSVWALPVPNSARAAVSEGAVLKPIVGSVVAVGWGQSRYLLVSQVENDAYLQLFTKKGHSPAPPSASKVAEPLRRELPLDGRLLPAYAAREPVSFVDRSGRLAVFAPSLPVDEVARDVLATTINGNWVVLARSLSERVALSAYRMPRAHALGQRGRRPEPIEPMFLGVDDTEGCILLRGGGDRVWCLVPTRDAVLAFDVLLRDDPPPKNVRDGESESINPSPPRTPDQRIARPPGAEPIGAVWEGASPSVVFLDETRTEVSFANADGRRVVFSWHAAAEYVAVDPAHRRLVLLTEQLEIVIADLATGQVLLHLDADGTAVGREGAS